MITINHSTGTVHQPRQSPDFRPWLIEAAGYLNDLSTHASLRELSALVIRRAGKLRLVECGE